MRRVAIWSGKTVHTMCCVALRLRWKQLASTAWNTQRKHNATLYTILPIFCSIKHCFCTVFAYAVPCCNNKKVNSIFGISRWNEYLIIIFIRFISDEHEYLIRRKHSQFGFCVCGFVIRRLNWIPNEKLISNIRKINDTHQIFGYSTI